MMTEEKLISKSDAIQIVGVCKNQILRYAAVLGIKPIHKASVENCHIQSWFTESDIQRLVEHRDRIRERIHFGASPEGMYSRVEAKKKLNISDGTFEKYRQMLGIIPTQDSVNKKVHWYTDSDLQAIATKREEFRAESFKKRNKLLSIANSKPKKKKIKRYSYRVVLREGGCWIVKKICKDKQSAIKYAQQTGMRYKILWNYRGSD